MADPVAYLIEGFDGGGNLYAKIVQFTVDEARNSAAEFARHYTTVSTTPLVRTSIGDTPAPQSTEGGEGVAIPVEGQQRERAKSVRMKFTYRCTKGCAGQQDCDLSCRHPDAPKDGVRVGEAPSEAIPCSRCTSDIWCEMHGCRLPRAAGVEARPSPNFKCIYCGLVGAVNPSDPACGNSRCVEPYPGKDVSGVAPSEGMSNAE